MINLFDLDKAALEAFFIENGEKRFRAAQVLKWIYHEGQKMTGVHCVFLRKQVVL